MSAQNVQRQGNVFVEQSDTIKEVKTEYTYKAKDGKTYPIFLSKNGKYYIKRVSKKSGKMYKTYLPEVTEQLSRIRK